MKLHQDQRSLCIYFERWQRMTILEAEMKGLTNGSLMTWTGQPSTLLRPAATHMRAMSLST